MKRSAINWRTRGLIMAKSFFEGRFICHWCCGRLTADEVVIDHFMPVAGGGDNDPENLVVSCARCNAWKSDADPMSAELMINRRLEAECVG